VADLSQPLADFTQLISPLREASISRLRDRQPLARANASPVSAAPVVIRHINRRMQANPRMRQPQRFPVVGGDLLGAPSATPAVNSASRLELHQALQGSAGFGNLRQLGVRVFEMAQEFLVGGDGLGFLAGLFQDFPQIEVCQGIR
jgi:hypothetical protein